MMKTVFTFLVALTMIVQPVRAEDSIDLMGNSSQINKPAKAPREVNPFSNGSPMAKAAASGFGLALLGPAGAIGIPIATIMVSKNNVSHLIEMNAFYSGTVVRGKITKIVKMDKFTGTVFGVAKSTLPSHKSVQDLLVAIIIDVDGPTDSERIMYARKDAGYEVGDIVDAKTINGVFAGAHTINEKLVTDFNKHIPRVVGIYCKHNNTVCQDSYESSLGVIARHKDTEFPPSQYLIDPAIIQADQAEMRKEEEARKAASSTDSGAGIM